MKRQPAEAAVRICCFMKSWRNFITILLGNYQLKIDNSHDYSQT